MVTISSIKLLLLMALSPISSPVCDSIKERGHGEAPARDASAPTLNTTAAEIYYFHQDHLGSSAWVTDTLGHAVQHLGYLPWGERYISQKTGNFSTIFTFSGKERDEETGYSYFGQRFYYSQLSLWLSVDPMRGKYPSLSPFVYCANNPIKLVDPNGMEIGDFYDWNGRYIGSDGKNDGKVYLLRNESLSKAELRNTKNFIKNNNGNASAFESNKMAYDSSIEIEPSKDNRQAMYNEVSKDNGQGGISPNNNREYGGYIDNGSVMAVEPGAVGDPSIDMELSIDLPKGYSTFHSHASGTKTVKDRTDKHEYWWEQAPTPSDIGNAGNHTHYVFGRWDKYVYIYNKNGIQATILTKKFINLSPK